MVSWLTPFQEFIRDRWRDAWKTVWGRATSRSSRGFWYATQSETMRRYTTPERSMVPIHLVVLFHVLPAMPSASHYSGLLPPAWNHSVYVRQSRTQFSAYTMWWTCLEWAGRLLSRLWLSDACLVLTSKRDRYYVDWTHTSSGSGAILWLIWPGVRPFRHVPSICIWAADHPPTVPYPFMLCPIVSWV